MSHDFDPGPVRSPFLALARDYPGAELYAPGSFRVEWGPVFHRGRLDGSARALVIGQDPGQHESIARRCMVGEAGQRVQGFLRKLGIVRSYVIVNAFLYSVFGQPDRDEVAELLERTAPYRERWFDALLPDRSVDVVIAFGGAAQAAFERWWGPPGDRRVDVEYAALLHPTFPEGSRQPGAMRRMLDQWNEALPRLRAALTVTDVEPDQRPYGERLEPGDRAQIPERDLPAGSPPWMRSLSQWASRESLLDAGASGRQKAEAKRATIVVEIPRSERPWDALDR